MNPPREYSGLTKESFLENKYAWMWINNGVVYQVYKPKLIITLDVAKTLVSDRLKISNGINRPGLLDARNLKHLERLAMRYYKKEETVQYLNSCAFIIDNYLVKLLYNAFIDLKRPLIPSKFFTNRDAAINWLGAFKFLN